MASERSTRRLGRGLDALLGTAGREPLRAGEVSAVREISIEEIRPNPFQPRKEYSATELEELRESLRANGLLQPIMVRVDRERGGYQLIAGERRWRAAQSLGWTDIPATIRDADDQTLLALALVENLQRADLNPLDEAAGYRRLMTEFGLTQQTVADLVGKRRSTVANLLRLLDLPEPVQAMVRSGAISAGQVRPLLALGDADQILVLAQEIRDRRLPARVVEERAAKRAQRPVRRKTSVRGRRDASARALEDNLRRFLQTDVRIAQRRGGAGDIMIRFYSSDDLERVLDRIGLRAES
jgi:ParB family chromosome partitioning protein